MRILVTGNAASGKTTLARLIAARAELPFHSLDSVVWQEGWRKTPAEEKSAAISELLKSPSWVIDGVSGLANEAADVIVYLDVPPIVCAWRGLIRALRYRSRTRPEFPANCPEWKILPQLFRIIFAFPGRAGVVIAEELNQRPGRFRVVRWPQSSKRLISEFSRTQGQIAT